MSCDRRDGARLEVGRLILYQDGTLLRRAGAAGTAEIIDSWR
jgi:hypothetical protein